MDEWKKSMRNAYSRKSEKDVIDEVLKIKAILDDEDKSRHSWALFNNLLPLELMGLSSDVVRTTGIGYSVFRFHDHSFKPVKNLVVTILEQWRSNIGPLVADGLESKKQDQERGDDESNKKHIMPSTDQKQIFSITKKNRPLVRTLYENVPVNSDKENMIITGDPNIPQQEVKSMRVADQVDRERMVQINSRKPNNPNGPEKLREGEANLKRKPLNMINEKKMDKKSCSSVEDKVEATKRKLYESLGLADQVDRERMVQINSRKTNVPSAKLREGEANLKRKPLIMINEKKMDKKSCTSVEEKVEATKRKLYESLGLADQVDSERMVQINSRKTNNPNVPSAKLREGEANLKKKPLYMINEKKLGKKSCSSVEEKMEATKRKLYESMGLADQVDRERMVQINSRKTNIPNGSSAKLREGEATLKRKPLNMIDEKKLDKKSCSNIEEKVEATKRKLHESYKEAEDAKKKRRIQVIEFHELGKQGLLPQVGAQMKKPHNTLIKKLRSNGHCCKTTLCY